LTAEIAPIETNSTSSLGVN